jgi:hypothetical protein
MMMMMMMMLMLMMIYHFVLDGALVGVVVGCTHTRIYSYLTLPTNTGALLRTRASRRPDAEPAAGQHFRPGISYDVM